MWKKSLKKLKDDRKYFAIVFFILVLLFLTAIINPLIINNIKKNWSAKLSEKISSIEKESIDAYKGKENTLLTVFGELKTKLHKNLSPEHTSYKNIVEIVNDPIYDDYSIEILAPNGRMIGWNKNIVIPEEEVFPLDYPLGETYFYNSDLASYLSIVDTVSIESDQFYLIFNKIVEKKYNLRSSYFNNVSFTNELNERFYTSLEVEYTPVAGVTRDNRKYSFEILNNKNHKIGLITFVKPTFNSNIESIQSTTAKIQAILIILIFVFIFLGFYKDYKKIKNKYIRAIIFIVLCIAARIILFISSFPTIFIKNEIIDPAYFSSTWGWGVVKSPLEFLITNLFLVLISLKLFSLIRHSVRNDAEYRKDKILIIIVKSIVTLALLFVILMLSRGLNASIKSIIFDSTLRYFKEPELIPNTLVLLMNFNILAFSFSILLLMIGLLIIINGLLIPKNEHRNKFLIGEFILLLAAGIFFVIYQRNPLTTVLINSILIVLVYAITIKIITDYKIFYNYVYIALAASIISITLLNYYNSQLERESLKTTALEITRANEGYFLYLINQTLDEASRNKYYKQYFYRSRTNFDAAAFKIWSGSLLQSENITSSIQLYNNLLEELGSFSVGTNRKLDIKEFDTSQTINEKIVGSIPLKENETETSIFSGIIPIYDNTIKIGYIKADIEYNLNHLWGSNIPDFIKTSEPPINSVLDFKEIKIFELRDNKLLQAYGNIYPSKEQIEPIVNAKYSQDNEAWIKLNLNGEDYTAYLMKEDLNGSSRIFSVLYKEKQFTWNLFNFFKLFIIHSLFIIILFILLFIIKIRSVKYSFRTQLLVTFLIISIIPIILLAIYNRQVVSQRSQTTIANELNERVNYVERHVNHQLQVHPERDILEAFDNAGKELGVSFEIFENTNQIYNSDVQYEKAGLFNFKLLPEVHYELNYLNYRDYLSKEKIESFPYNAYYKKVNFIGNNYVLSVNDVFNKIYLPFSPAEVDIFLFGVYSFAVIIIILISTIMANRFSKPVRKLTKATDSIAQGDFNIQIENQEKGEFKDLIDSFNLMTRELKKNEAELAALERENAWKEMARQVAHEIKNPLTPMKLAMQQLMASYREKSDKFDIIFEKISATILNQIENLSQIASEFSNFARMPNYKLEVVDLIPILKDVINLFTEEQIKINYSTNLNTAKCEADSSQLRRILINLVRNSIQAGASKINIKIYIENLFYYIIFEDNGKGIEEQHQNRIFESNFTTKEKGMGLGLKLAKRFLEGINGDICLDKSSSKGTTFQIKIPVLEKK